MSENPSYFIVSTGVLCPLLCISAGAVYLKNCVFKYWKPHDPSDVGDELGSCGFQYLNTQFFRYTAPADIHSRGHRIPVLTIKYDGFSDINKF